jgi:hypothetical protein
MQEPYKTRLIAALGIVCLAALGLCLHELLTRYDLTAQILGFSITVLSALVWLILARVEYGEWMKGVPWWTRMADGYRPPIKLPARPPKAAP